MGDINVRESRSCFVDHHMSLQLFECIPGYFWLTLVLQLVTQMRTCKCNICRNEAAFSCCSGECRRVVEGCSWGFIFNHQTTLNSQILWLLSHHQDLCPALCLSRSSLVWLGCSETSLPLFLYTCLILHSAAVWLIFQAAYHKIFFASPLCLMTDISSLQG